MAKNTTLALKLCEKGLQWCTESKALEIFKQIRELLQPTDAREERMEPTIRKAARKKAV